MLNKIFLISLITGIGYLLNLFTLNYISNNSSLSIFSLVGEIDSFLLLLISFIQFGIQLSSQKQIINSKANWKNKYYDTQKARLSLSIILFFLFFFTSGNKYLFLLIAPLIALNPDYALYAKGYPILASFLTLKRNLIISLSIIFVTIYYPVFILETYFVSTFISYFISGYVSSKVLLTNYLVKPDIKSLKEYYNNFWLGVSTVMFSFLGLGIINVVSYFYNDENLSILYFLLKIYFILKSIRRVILQSFLSNIKSNKINIKVDFIVIFISLITFLIFNNYTNFIYEITENSIFLNQFYFKVLGLIYFLISFSISSGTLVLLNKSNKIYNFNVIISASFFIISIIIFSLFFEQDIFVVLVLLFLSEFLLIILNLYQIDYSFTLKRIRLFYPFYIIIILNLFFSSDIYVFLFLLFSGIYFIYFYNLKNKSK